MFENASRTKLRIASDRGLLSAEDLWDLSLTELNSIAKKLNAELKSSAEEDFLEETSSEDKVTKLKFEIVLHIINTRKAENSKRKEYAELKAKRDKLLAIKAKKQDDSLENMSIEELDAELEALDI
jgi:hypothetical protein